MNDPTPARRPFPSRGPSGETTETTPRAADGQRAGWFELFFDLVFVVTVNVLADGLHGDPGPADFGRFLVLFFPAWWAWINLTMTSNVFGPSTPRVQAMLLAAMPGLGLMAAAAPEGLGDRAWAFALGVAWVHLVLFLPWQGPARRAEIGLPRWRPVLYGLVPALLWATSAALPAPGRFALWAVAIGLEIALLAHHSVATRVYEALVMEHLVERIGLFMVIVFGESVLTIVTALTDHFTPTSAAAALTGFLTIAGLAVVFYLWGSPTTARGLDHVQATGTTRAIRDTVMFLPFALVAGTTVIAAALGTATAEPDHPFPTGAGWALLGGFFTYYTTSAALALRYGDTPTAVLRWYVPCLLTVAALLPAVLLLPAWAAVATTAAALLAVIAWASRP
ncbi:low temperature requirement protein A [Streptomyces sp. NPDC091377]|uniref:low temperature requirement protein A n=1 Tax=Streptomyces sp. NPDC091377 TaxID=3365995 RepID=UPI00382AE266